MRVLMFSIDSKICEKGSDVQNRMISYGSLFDELHIVVYTTRGFKEERIASNVFVYPTNTKTKFFYFWNAYTISKKIIGNWKLPAPLSADGLGEIGNSVITSQEAFTNIVAVFMRWRFKIPLQIQIHTDFLSPYFKSESFKNFFKYWGYILGIKNADTIRVVSKRIKDSLGSIVHSQSSVFSVLPIWVDIDKIKNTPITIDLHKKYPQFDFIILMASRLTKEKNISLAFKILEKIIEKYPRTGLVIAGDGPKCKTLKSQVTSYKLEANVIFEGWVSNLATYYKTADLYLLTSNYEGYGVAIADAAVAECPIVSTDVGLIGDVFKKGEHLLACEVGDDKCLFEKILIMMENAHLRKDMTKKAHDAIVKQSLSHESYLKAYKESFNYVG